MRAAPRGDIVILIICVGYAELAIARVAACSAALCAQIRADGLTGPRARTAARRRATSARAPRSCCTAVMLCRARVRRARFARLAQV